MGQRGREEFCGCSRMTRRAVIPELSAVCPLPLTVTAAFVPVPTVVHCVQGPLQTEDCDRKQQ